MPQSRGSSRPGRGPADRDGRPPGPPRRSPSSRDRSSRRRPREYARPRAQHRPARSRGLPASRRPSARLPLASSRSAPPRRSDPVRGDRRGRSFPLAPATYTRAPSGDSARPSQECGSGCLKRSFPEAASRRWSDWSSAPVQRATTRVPSGVSASANGYGETSVCVPVGVSRRPFGSWISPDGRRDGTTRSPAERGEETTRKNESLPRKEENAGRGDRMTGRLAIRQPSFSPITAETPRPRRLARALHRRVASGGRSPGSARPRARRGPRGREKAEGAAPPRRSRSPVGSASARGERTGSGV